MFLTEAVRFQMSSICAMCLAFLFFTKQSVLNEITDGTFSLINSKITSSIVATRSFVFYKRIY